MDPEQTQEPVEEPAISQRLLQFNEITIEGQAVDDATVKLVNIGNRQAYVENFTLASNRRDQNHDDTLYVRVSRWYNSTDNVPQSNIKKGDRIDVTGLLSTSSFQLRNNGVPLYACDANAQWAKDNNGNAYPVMQTTLELRARRVVNRTVNAIRMIKTKPELLNRDISFIGNTNANAAELATPAALPTGNVTAQVASPEEDLPF